MGAGRTSRLWPAFLFPSGLSFRNTACGAMGYLCPADSAALTPFHRTWPRAPDLLLKEQSEGRQVGIKWGQGKWECRSLF